MPQNMSGIPQFNKDELKELLEDTSWRIIDVRTDAEYRAGHIPDVPLKSMQDIGTWMGDLDPTQSYVFVCRSGGRSQQVAQYLHENGFEKVANFNGGMLSWDGETKPGVEP